MAGLEKDRLPVDPEQLTPQEHDAQEESMQARFERLLAQAHAKQQTVTEQTGTFDVPNVGLIEEEVFATYDTQGRPQTGIRWKNSQMTVTYGTHMVTGKHPEFGDVMVVETRTDVENPPRHMSGLDYGRVSAFLSERVDEPLIQAATNAVGVPVLHTIEHISIGSARIEGLVANGYSRRRGYLTAYDKVFQPQKRN